MYFTNDVAESLVLDSAKTESPIPRVFSEPHSGAVGAFEPSGNLLFILKENISENFKSFLIVQVSK